MPRQKRLCRDKEEKIMSLKKILAMSLALALSLSCLFGCELVGGSVDAVAAMKEAEGTLTDSQYTAVVTTEISAKDPALKERIDALGESNITIVYGDAGFKLRSDMSIDGARVFGTYTAFDGVLYFESMATVGEDSSFLKQKARIDQMDLNAFTSHIGAGIQIDYTDFESVVASGSAGKCTVTCTDLKDELVESAEYTLSSMLGDDFKLTLSDVVYVATLKDRAFMTESVKYMFSVEMDGALYNMESVVTIAYDYSTEISISAPADAEMYDEISFENMIR